MHGQFQVRTPTVIHEVFEDEVVIVDLDSGNYFSLSDAGVACWNCILAGCSIEETTSAMLLRYEGSAEEIRSSITALIESLEQEQLIVRVDSGNVPKDVTGILGDGPKIRFRPPSLNRYSDMQDLLLIDPIHDVDETGWPQTKEDAGDSSTE